jgi:collagenase-like PrtC family protease
MLLNEGKMTRNLQAKMKNYWEAVDLLRELNHDKILEMNKRVFPDLEIFKHGELKIPQEYRKNW